MDVGHEAEHAERRAGGEALERRAQRVVVAGDQHARERTRRARERPRDVGQAPDRTVGARHREHHGHVVRHTEFAPRLARIRCGRERRAHRHAGHHHAVAGNATRDEIMADLLGSHAVTVDAVRDPLRMRDEVGHHRRVRWHASAGARESRHGDGGGRVHGDNGVGGVPLESRGETPRTHP